MDLQFSICTPVYNRAHLLPRLYSSILKNVNDDISFEWLMVDDGSTDDIESFVSMVNAEKKVPFRYIKKPNEGKHSCMNVFFKEAKGELTLILDSDDMLVEGALIEVISIWNKISKRADIAGIIGLCLDMATLKCSGDYFPYNGMESTLLENSYKHNMKGDRCDFVRTSLLRGREFPIYENEKFMPEAVVMVQLDANYKYYCTNSAFKIIEYQVDGLTNTYDQLAVKNTKGMVLRFKVIVVDYNLIKLPQGLNKAKFYGNYMRYLIHQKGYVNALKEYCSLVKYFKLNWFIGAVLGSILAIRDKKIKTN